MSEERFYCETCQLDWLAEYSLWNLYTAECPECGAHCNPLKEEHSRETASDTYDEPGDLTDSRDLEAVAAEEAADLTADMASADQADGGGDGDSDGGEGK